MEPPPSVVDVGDPSSSLQLEYERRSAVGEKRARARFPAAQAQVNLGPRWPGTNAGVWLEDSLGGGNPASFDPNSDRKGLVQLGVGVPHNLNNIKDKNGRAWNYRGAGVFVSQPPIFIAGDRP
jgi:hypothetical protein